MRAALTLVLAFCVCLPYTSAESQLDLQAFTLVHKVPNYSRERNFSEPWYYKADGEILPKTNNDDNSIHFATCLATENKHVCNVTRLTYVFENGTIEDKCNNIQLTSTKNIKVIPLLTNSLFLVQWNPTGNNESETQVTFVNLDNCKVFDLHYIKPDIHPVVFNDRVDMFRNSSNECGNMDSCRISYDYNGKLIGKPTPFTLWPALWPNATTIITPADPQSPDQGYVVRLWNHETNRVTTMHLNAVGEESFHLEERVFLTYMTLPDISTAHGVHSGCWRLDESIHCQQIYDQKFILNKTLDDFPWTSHVNLLSVHSLAKGAILLAVVGCDEHNRCTTMRWRIVKLEQKERENHRWLVVRGIDFQLEMPYANEIRLTENGDRYCLALAYVTNTWDEKKKTYMSYLKYRKWYLLKKHVAALDITSVGKSP